MSKPSARATRRKSTRQPATRPTRDRTIYLGFTVIGGFVGFLAAVLTGGAYWKHALLAYAAIVAFFIHRSALGIYRGRHDLTGWQRALARLPLRCVGYGSEGGKPAEASHGDPKALRMILVSALLSVVVIGGLAAWLLI